MCQALRKQTFVLSKAGIAGHLSISKAAHWNVFKDVLNWLLDHCFTNGSILSKQGADVAVLNTYNLDLVSLLPPFPPPSKLPPIEWFIALLGQLWPVCEKWCLIHTPACPAKEQNSTVYQLPEAWPWSINRQTSNQMNCYIQPSHVNFSTFSCSNQYANTTICSIFPSHAPITRSASWTFVSKHLMILQQQFDSSVMQ